MAHSLPRLRGHTQTVNFLGLLEALRVIGVDALGLDSH